MLCRSGPDSQEDHAERVGSIVDGRSTDFRSPRAIGTGDEQHIAQVARVGHGVFLVGQSLIDIVAEFRGG